MIQNADQVAGNTQVEVIGGYLNGNRVDQAANSDGINFVNVTNFLIRYVHTYDFYRNGMRLQDCISGRVAGCLVDYSYQDGLVILGGSTHLTIIGNEVRLSRNGVGADGVGIFIVLGMRNEIIGNNVHENMNGIEVRGFENTITGNDCHLNYGCGIVIASNLNPGNVVTGNQVHGNGLDGIRVMIQQTVITGNAVRDNSYTGAGGTLNTRDGIHVEADACVVVGNSAVNSDATFHQRHGIFVSGNSCVVEGNDCRYNRTDGIHAETGDRILISGNTCENNANYGIKIDADADYCRVEGNITTANTTGSVHVANANCDNTVITNNNLDENVITDVGTNTRAWLNYDPSANAFVATINAPTVVGGGGGALP
jgi:parallel beta-helix repeat protein